MTTEKQYIEVTLDDVLAYYEKGFKPKKGEVIKWHGETLVDISKRKVIFQLTVEKK